MKKTIGVFAHIDAGKTTFCEQLFYLSGAIRSCGRVDHGDAVFDTHAIERERGVTVFAHEGRFTWNGNTYYVIDTPGHADFASEAERVIDALDAAILLIDAVSGVRPQTRALFRLLSDAKKPCFFFINKTDMPACNVERTLKMIRTRLSEDAFLLDLQDESCFEEAAMRDEAFMERYLAGGADRRMLFNCLQTLVKQRKAFPVLCGSALTGAGVADFLNLLDRLVLTQYQDDAPFFAKIFRVECREEITAFLKIEAGTLHVRDAFVCQAQTQKISGVRLYRADRFERVTQASAGDVVAVTGLPFAQSGMVLKAGEAQFDAPHYSVRAAAALRLKAAAMWTIFRFRFKARSVRRLRHGVIAAF